MPELHLIPLIVTHWPLGDVVAILTHWGRDKMAAISQTTILNAFSSMKIYELKFVPKGRIINIPALVQIMAWCRLGNKPLSERMMVGLLTHICVTRPQWVKSVTFKHMFGIKSLSTSCEFAPRWIPLNTFDGKSAFDQVMACCSLATRHYLSQCWPRYLWLYGLTMPQRFKSSPPGQNGGKITQIYNFRCTMFNETLLV